MLNGKDFQSLLGSLKVSQIDFVSDLTSAARVLILELFEPEPKALSPNAGDSTSLMQGNTERVSPTDNAVLAQSKSRAGIPPKRSPNGWGIAREPGQITYYQMHACLRGMFKRTDREKAEIIYSWTSSADIDVKVFTSIDARTGLARPIGEDAIRIVVYDQRAKRKIIAWSVELKRTGSWHTRLQEKTGAAILRASFRPHCPGCHQDTMIIYGRPDAQFWGCSNYPKCGGTSDLYPEGGGGTKSGSAIA
jgi:hypothetical protein